MKILLVHNDYGKYSGEEAVVDRMNAMFQALGHKVVQLRRSTANIRESAAGKIRTFTNGIYSPAGVRAMRDIINTEKPDLVNIHNLFPFIGPAALRECKKAGVPVVMTVHNYRLVCPTGLFFNNGMPCELCLDNGNEWNCIKRNCENSIPKSVAYALRNFIARKKRHYLECVDIFACLTEFQKNKLIQAGYPENKIYVIPNSFDSDIRPTFETGQYVAFSGRISHEKGIDLIIETARRNPSIPFRLAGALRDSGLTGEIPENVVFEGHLSGNDYLNFLSHARFIVMASRCYEGFPMAILEGAAHGKPVVAPDHGGFTEIVGKNNSTGRLFMPGNVVDLEKQVRLLWNDTELCRQLGMNAHKKLIECYSTQAVSKKWADIIGKFDNRPLKPHRINSQYCGNIRKKM